MKKSVRLILLVSSIVLIAILFSAATCSVGPGPGPGTYYVRIINNSGNTLWLYVNGVYSKTINALTTSTTYGFTGADFISLWNWSGGFWVQDGWGNNQWNTWTNLEFTYNGGGVWISPEK